MGHGSSVMVATSCWDEGWRHRIDSSLTFLIDKICDERTMKSMVGTVVIHSSILAISRCLMQEGWLQCGKVIQATQQGTTRPVHGKEESSDTSKLMRQGVQPKTGGCAC